MHAIDVAVPTPLARTFTYLSPTPVAPGCRVLVPFGRRQLVGVALGPAGAPAEAGIELKPVTSLIDETPVYSAALLEIGRWLAGYYLHPIGEVLRTMLPASSTKVVKQSYVLTRKGRDLVAAGVAPEADLLGQVFVKKGAVTNVTLKARLKKLAGPDASGGLWGPPPTTQDLAERGLITLSRGTKVKARVRVETEEVVDGDGGRSRAPLPTTSASTASYADASPRRRRP